MGDGSAPAHPDERPQALDRRCEVTTHGLYLLTLWEAVQRAEASGFTNFAQALRSELGAEMMRTNRKHFIAFVLSL
jgi:hypothetical protein